MEAMYGMVFDLPFISQLAARFLDFIGISIILVGVVGATVWACIKFCTSQPTHDLYNSYRWNLSRSIMIGLEFLVASDIVRSAGGQLSFDAVIILALIVLVRAFLGIQFQMEIDGHWPWQRPRHQK